MRMGRVLAGLVLALVAQVAVSCSSVDGDATPAGTSVAMGEGGVPSTVGSSGSSGSSGSPDAVDAEFAALRSWCERVSTSITGSVRVPALTEISGLATSRRDPVVVWVHNDSGDTAVVHAIDETGEHRARVEVGGVRADDWEDIALGPGPVDGDPWVFVADIGDNAVGRSSVGVVRFVEPVLPATKVAGERVEVVYPDGPHDAEAFFVHPRTGDWYVLTKEASRSSTLFRALRPGPGVRKVTLEAVGYLDARPDRITAADLSPDGSLLAVRTYASLRVFAVTGDDVAGALGRAPCRRSVPDELQGESVGFRADGRTLLTVSEGTTPDLHLTG